MKEQKKYSKEQLLESDKYKAKRDFLTAALKDGEYTFEEVDKKIEAFTKRKVK